jgi:hypothetical protein
LVTVLGKKSIGFVADNKQVDCLNKKSVIIAVHQMWHFKAIAVNVIIIMGNR